MFSRSIGFTEEEPETHSPGYKEPTERVWLYIASSRAASGGFGVMDDIRKKRRDFWMPWHIDDHRRDTQHLSTLEDGAYRKLLDHCWQGGNKLPGNGEMLRRIAGLTAKEWKASGPILIAFFDKTANGLSHKRVAIEQEVMSRQKSQKAAAGRASWASRQANGCSTAVQREVNGSRTAYEPRAGAGAGAAAGKELHARERFSDWDEEQEPF